jgi:hypothetical protein
MVEGHALVHYDAMCRAIAETYEVDEVKDIRDKALALEIYARQANNIEAEQQACRIRLRAERRSGELLAETKHLGRPQKVSPRATLSDLSISRDQSSDWQKMAEVPEEEFEAALAGEKPSTAGIVALADPARKRATPVDHEALYLWGRLSDFERHGLLERDPDELLSTMTEPMRETVARLAPEVADWLRRFP